MNQKSKLFPLLFALLYAATASAQLSSFDGIEVGTLSANRATYYYGEPFRMFFVFSNKTNTIKQYYTPDVNVSFRIKLRDLKTGEIINSNTAEYFDYLDNSGSREYRKEHKPDAYYSFKPHQKIPYYPHMLQSFGSVKLIDKDIRGLSLLKYNLAAIPVGEYEMILEYFLFPTDKILTKSVKFKIINVPDNLRPAFEQYIKTTFYAKDTHWEEVELKNKLPYAPAHPDSYENFFKKHSNTIFADYAMIDANFQVFNIRSFTKEQLQKKQLEYIDYYPKITRSDIKLAYVRILPQVVFNLCGRDKEKATIRSKDVLKNKLKDSHEASELYIEGSRSITVGGLKNYAQKPEGK